jgi:GT2 family glycosyltransferase
MARGDKAERDKTGDWKPVLGIGDPREGASVRRDWRERAANAGLGTAPGTVFDQPEPEELIELTVIVPARNEEDCLGDCLQSLVSQSEDIFALGKDWDLIVVDDYSTDRTAEIARGFDGITVMEAGKLEPGWTGKNNAIWTAARRARGRWLLFTDADTIHEPGGLRHAMHEAERHKVGMLSYSPRQIVKGFAQRSLMPLVFCELALAYPPAKVSDPAQRIAAANGQFLLVDREAYRKLGGHASVSGKVLEDVELAVLAKRRRVGLRGRHRLRAHVPHDCGHGRRLDQEFETALQQRADAGDLQSAGFFSSFWPAGVGLGDLERATGRARTGVDGRGMGSGSTLAAQSVPVLQARGKVEFSTSRLRNFAVGFAAVCCAALSQLVSA